MTAKDWLGHFEIYVGNYFVDDIRAHLHNCASQPDVDATWTWGNGWALGANSRDKYCKRSNQNVRRFNDYLEAREYAQQLMRKPARRDHDLFIVYSGSNLQRVDTLEQAIALDTEQRSEIAKRDQANTRGTADNYPALSELRQRHRGSLAVSLSCFLKELREAGDDISKVIAGGSVTRSTAYSYRNHLQDAGLMPNLGPED